MNDSLQLGANEIPNEFATAQELYQLWKNNRSYIFFPLTRVTNED